MHRVHITKLVQPHTPEMDLQEISFLDDPQMQPDYKAPFTDRNINYFLQGWIKPTKSPQNPLPSFRSTMMEPASPTTPLKKQKMYTTTMKHRRSESFNNEKGIVMTRYHIRRVQSHDWDADTRPIHSQKVFERKCLPVQRNDLEIKLQQVQKRIQQVQKRKEKPKDPTQLVKRESVGAVSYPVTPLSECPERRISGSVGRVRRLLKIKLPKKKMSMI